MSCEQRADASDKADAEVQIARCEERREAEEVAGGVGGWGGLKATRETDFHT